MKEYFAQQEQACKARQKMLEWLISYEPVWDMTIKDARFIADRTYNLVYDAIETVISSEDRT